MRLERSILANCKALTNVSAIHTFLGSKKERIRNPCALDDLLNTSYFGFDWSRYAKKRAQTTTAKNLERPAKKTKVSTKVEQMLQFKIQQLEGMTNVVAEQGADLFEHKICGKQSARSGSWNMRRCRIKRSTPNCSAFTPTKTKRQEA